MSVDAHVPGVAPRSTDALSGSPVVRRVGYALVLAAVFHVAFGVTWLQTVVLVAVLLLADVAELGAEFSRVDSRHFRAVLGFVLVVGGGSVALGGPDAAVGGFLAAVGGWVVLDAVYALRAGIRPDDPEEDIDASEAMLTIQLGHLVAQELKEEPKTVPELATACDLTESRVRMVLQRHQRTGVVYREGDRWVLDESRVGIRAFVRDNVWWVARRLLRPFGLFVPS